MKILIILGSTREGRKGDKVAQWVMEQTPKEKGISFELVDLREYPMKFYNEPIHPSMLHGECHDKYAAAWITKVKEADGYIIVTPEYNHAPSAVLKNALDYPYSEWNKKPVGFVSYGGFAGGARAVEQLRMIAVELQLVSVRDAVVISFISEHVVDDKFVANEKITKTLAGMFSQLLWWGRVLKEAREKDGAAER